MLRMMVRSVSQLPNQVPDIDDLLGVKAVRRLVEDDDVRIPDDGARDADPLPVALGQVFDHSVEDVLDFHHLADLRNVLFAVEGASFQVVDEIKILLDGHFEIKRRHFRQKADLLFDLQRMLKDVKTVDHGLARCRGKISREDVHRRGFARAVRPEESDDFSLFHLEADVVYGISVAVFLG